MRHKNNNRKLGRKSHQRQALLRNLSEALLEEERIITTVEKAKETQPFVEKLITKAGEYSLHRYRQVLSTLQNEDMTKKLFDKIGPMFEDRPGGYTRVIRLGGDRFFEGGKYASHQLDDRSERALFELVEKTEDYEPPEQDQEEEDEEDEE